MKEIRIKLPGFDTVLTPIHKAGYPFIGLFALVSFIFFSFSEPLGWIGVILTLWCTYFFRNPCRIVPQDDTLIISPADGIVQKIEKAVPPEELGMGTQKMTRVSVFLNVFNVHVNRTPCAGVIKALHYRPGKFFNASLDKASIDNERMSILMETKSKKQLAFVQIAGLVARRIICNLKEGDEIQAGEVFGLIRFGSRVDIYLPGKVNPLVIVGQTMIAGESIIAAFDENRKSYKGSKI